MTTLSRNITIAALLLIVGALLYVFRDIVSYVLVAWVISMVGRPVVRLLQEKVRFKQWRMGASMAAAITLVAFFTLAALLVMIFVPLVAEQLSNLSGVDYRSIAQALEVPYQGLQTTLQQYGIPMQDQSLAELLQATLSQFFNPGELTYAFSGILSAAGSIVAALFSVIFISFFFLKENGLFLSFLTALVPNEYEQQVQNSVNGISRLLSRYFQGILLQITIITIFVSSLLALMGIKNALLIGLFAAFINVIPFVGPVIGAVFGVLITVSSNLDLEFYTQMLPMLFQVVAVFAAMQLLDNFVLQPVIFSKSVMAHPLEIFIVILMGAQVNGILGMVLAIPTYTVLRVVAGEFLSKLKIVQRITSQM